MVVISINKDFLTNITLECFYQILDNFFVSSLTSKVDQRIIIPVPHICA